jgi:sulfur carrier protein ThiS adenylyltransferase
MNYQDYFCERDPLAFPQWQKAVVGIAGAGGLGSNAAILLARAGIGKLIIADFDIVSVSNLNRQAFNLDQIGEPKVEALAANIRRVNPFIQLEIHCCRLNPENIPGIYAQAEVMIEAFDKALQKQMLIETWLSHYPGKPLICASGLAGFGRSDEIRIEHQNGLFIVGDQSSELQEGISPIAPRVMIVAAMQANLCLEIISKAQKDNT